MDECLSRLSAASFVSILSVLYDSKGEFLITVMSSLSQEESRSISENVRWGMRKKMQDGKYSVVYSHFLGYDRGPDGGMVINHNEAKVVRFIYRSCLQGRLMVENGGTPPLFGIYSQTRG